MRHEVNIIRSIYQKWDDKGSSEAFNTARIYEAERNTNATQVDERQ